MRGAGIEVQRVASAKFEVLTADLDLYLAVYDVEPTHDFRGSDSHLQ
jgi:hypothetical protein